MRKYEILMLLRPNLEADVKSKTIEQAEKLIGGNIVKKEEWGLKKLAYPIKKEVEAEYILYYVETEGENVIEFRKAVNISKEIMRALVLVHEKDFPFNRRTTKDMVIQKRERKPRFNKDAKKPAEKAESKNTNEDLTKLKKDELIKLASDKGVEVKASMKKADIIKAIEEA